MDAEIPGIKQDNPQFTADPYRLPLYRDDVSIVAFMLQNMTVS
ncbi:hypothetical protein [Kluyvera ascorbata]|jgi:hypothetical protein